MYRPPFVKNVNSEGRCTLTPKEWGFGLLGFVFDIPGILPHKLEEAWGHFITGVFLSSRWKMWRILERT